VKSGESANISANGKSEDNRPLEFKCISTAGHLKGEAPLFAIETTGLPDSVVHIDCIVKDDRYLTANANAILKVNVPLPPPPPPAASVYGLALDFSKDPRHSMRVDNAAKGMLDRYADYLTSELGAKGVIVAYDTEAERKVSKYQRQHHKLAEFAMRRAVNIKNYLVTEKGLDPTRLVVRNEEDGSEAKAVLWVVPIGANFNEQNTTAVDEQKVKAVPRVLPKVAHKKRAPQPTLAKK
jgi:hypothetical protein